MALILKSSHSVPYILNTNMMKWDKCYCLHFTKEEMEAQKLSVLLLTASDSQLVSHTAS